MSEEDQRKLSANSRISVSAEVFGRWNKKEEFKARVIQKSEETKKKILERLQNAFMFNSVDSKDFDVVIDAMDERNVKAGETIIRQGAKGQELFLVEQGTLECFRRPDEESDEKFLKNYEPGEVFGELALLYNAPRAATIKAKTDSKLWVLDRATFNHIVKDAA